MCVLIKIFDLYFQSLHNLDDLVAGVKQYLVLYPGTKPLGQTYLLVKKHTSPSHTSINDP